jgi:RNA polymerase sigma-70 factor, ECF subfamily
MTDQNQFELFMRQYQAMVFTTALRLLGNEADAEDISQNAFLKAYENFAALANNPAAGGWLKKVTTNLSLNHLTRYRARWRFFSEMTSAEEETDFAATLPAPSTWEKELAEAEYRQVLEEVLMKLPNAQRIPLVLYHFEGMSYQEIAAHLKISLSKLKVDIHRGRLALARYLKPGLLGNESTSQAGRRITKARAYPAGDAPASLNLWGAFLPAKPLPYGTTH